MTKNFLEINIFNFIFYLFCIFVCTCLCMFLLIYNDTFSIYIYIYILYIYLYIYIYIYYIYIYIHTHSAFLWRMLRNAVPAPFWLPERAFRQERSFPLPFSNTNRNLCINDGRRNEIQIQIG